MKEKSNYSTIRIRADQFSALLQIATAQQKELGTVVTVGTLVRRMVDRVLEVATGDNQGDRRGIYPDPRTDQ